MLVLSEDLISYTFMKDRKQQLCVIKCVMINNLCSYYTDTVGRL